MRHPPTYRQVAPPDVLRPFVDFLWINDIVGPVPEGGRRLLPDGRASLVWIPNRSLHVSGPQTRFKQPGDAEGIRVFGARIRAGAVRALLGLPTTEVVDEHIPLAALDPRLSARLASRLDATTDTRSALRVLAGELTRALVDVPPPDPAVATAVRLLDRSGATVADTAAQIYLSERALQRRFAEDVGYSPKTLQRVLRFQRFLDVVPRAELAGAAATAGYADQSHLTREARRLAGLTPQQLRSYEH